MDEPRTLAIDIGGTGIKAALLDDAGSLIGERQRVPTPPKPVAPEDLVRAIDEVAAPLGTYERVSVGFPGYVRDGRVITAPNLGTDALAGFDLQSVLAEHLGKPVRVLNDADVQGFGAIKGQGLEMVLTLGTGAGTALFHNGQIMPHLELAHHPVSGNKTYEQYVGNAARRKKGKKAWNKRVAKVIDILREVVRFDHLYIGGGNAKDITFPLPPDVTIVPNTDGLTGGIRLWQKNPTAHAAADVPSRDGPAPEPEGELAAWSARPLPAEPVADGLSHDQFFVAAVQPRHLFGEHRHAVPVGARHPGDVGPPEAALRAERIEHLPDVSVDVAKGVGLARIARRTGELEPDVRVFGDGQHLTQIGKSRIVLCGAAAPVASHVVDVQFQSGMALGNFGESGHVSAGEEPDWQLLLFAGRPEPAARAVRPPALLMR